MVSGAPIAYDERHLDNVRYNAEGLVPAVVQDVESRRVLMLGWMNDTSLRRTLDTGRSWFWSRSRQEYWCKGETSGDRQYVRRASYDCDGDTILLEVEQTGRGACHTGAYSCFFRSFDDAPTNDAPTDDAPTDDGAR